MHPFGALAPARTSGLRWLHDLLSRMACSLGLRLALIPVIGVVVASVTRVRAGRARRRDRRSPCWCSLGGAARGLATARAREARAHRRSRALVASARERVDERRAGGAHVVGRDDAAVQHDVRREAVGRGRVAAGEGVGIGVGAGRRRRAGRRARPRRSRWRQPSYRRTVSPASAGSRAARAQKSIHSACARTASSSAGVAASASASRRSRGVWRASRALSSRARNAREAERRTCAKRSSLPSK